MNSHNQKTTEQRGVVLKRFVRGLKRSLDCFVGMCRSRNAHRKFVKQNIKMWSKVNYENRRLKNECSRYRLALEEIAGNESGVNAERADVIAITALDSANAKVWDGELKPKENNE